MLENHTKKLDCKNKPIVIETMASALKDWKDKSLCVVTCDGRVILGILEGHDQVQNLILKDAQERIHSDDNEVEIADLGLYVIRGDNVCLIGEYDENSWNDAPSPPLPKLTQHM